MPTPTPLTRTHTAADALERGTQLLVALSDVCPEAAWVGGHLVRALAHRDDIDDWTDFDIAVPRSKLDAIEAHIATLGWVRYPTTDAALDETPLPHRRWWTATRERFEPDTDRWPDRVTVDLVVYDDPAGESLPELVERFDLNVLHLWAVVEAALPQEPVKERWEVSQGRFGHARANPPPGWGALTQITDALYLVDPTGAQTDLLDGDIRIVPGAWIRPWRLGKYRLALGLGPLSGEWLPLVRPPGVKRDALPPAGFQWVEYRDMQSWRNHGPCRAPWVLGDLSTYTDAQALHDLALARGVARVDECRPERWVTWDLYAKTSHEGVMPITVQHAYVLDVHPGNPDAPQPGQYVREWTGDVRQTDPENGLCIRAIRFPEDVFNRIVALRGEE